MKVSFHIFASLGMKLCKHLIDKKWHVCRPRLLLQLRKLAFFDLQPTHSKVTRPFQSLTISSKQNHDSWAFNWQSKIEQDDDRITKKDRLPEFTKSNLEADLQISEYNPLHILARAVRFLKIAPQVSVSIPEPITEATTFPDTTEGKLIFSGISQVFVSITPLKKDHVLLFIPVAPNFW